MQSVCVWASFNGVPARVDVEMHHQLLVAMAAHVEPHACELRDRPIVASFVCRVFTSYLDQSLFSPINTDLTR
jgi:hypothetical protein